MATFMGSGDTQGWLRKYLSWERPELKGDVGVCTLILPELQDEETPGPLQNIRAAICAIAELFAQKYDDAFPQLGSFVSGVWEMLTTVGPGTGEDLVSSSEPEIGANPPASVESSSILVRGGEDGQSSRHVFIPRYHASLLRADHLAQHEHSAWVHAFVKLADCSTSEHEEEMFEDDPGEYIRRDLEPSTGSSMTPSFERADLVESDTRRQAATDFTQALMELFEGPVTEIITGFITTFLNVSVVHALSLNQQDYGANPHEKWKSKDTAIYLLTSIAARGSTQQVCCRAQLGLKGSSASPRPTCSSMLWSFSGPTSSQTSKRPQEPSIPS